MKQKNCLVGIALFGVILIACAGSKMFTIIETSGPKPGWVKKDVDYFEEDESYHFRGLITERQDLSLAKNEAESEAIEDIASGIEQIVGREFQSATTGSNVDPEALGYFVQHVVVLITKSVAVQGIKPDRSYWEYIEENTPMGPKRYYRYWTLTQIAATDYQKALNDAIKKKLEDYINEKNEKARLAAEEVKARLLESE